MCVQKITLRNCSAIATKAKVVAESMGTGLICYYWNGEILYEGNREMGDYLNDKKIGKHITLTNNGEILTNIYN